ncbi:hypothetical protein V9T40_007082 [Parthenolecanium corni]|uniref:Uncharacterized protein n=1 Tax=Parthenolecanium corni TaxID=536013 RepID=A0AAN9YBB0_9HEMI
MSQLHESEQMPTSRKITKLYVKLMCVLQMIIQAVNHLAICVQLRNPANEKGMNVYYTADCSEQTSRSAIHDAL